MNKVPLGGEEMEEPLIIVHPVPNEDEKRESGIRISSSSRRRLFGEIKDEGERLGRLAGPMVAVTLSQYLLQVISNMMAGHLGELSLSSVAIGNSLVTVTVTGFSLLLGMASGMETLCGQAYGAKQYQKLGILMYRAIFTLVLVCLPISILWLYMERILCFMGQDPQISQEAGNYVVWMIPGLFAYATSQPLMKFLQSQSLTFPMFLSSLLTLVLHIPLCWLLVFKTGLGNVGAALSMSMLYWLNALILGLYIIYSESCKMTRSPITKEAFRGIIEFLRLAIPSATMMCLEWWSFELLILLSGLLPNPKLETAVLSVCLTSISCLYAIPYGLSAAVSTRVSNELGAGNPQRARLAVRVVMVMALSEAIVVSVTLFALRKVVGYAYTNEREVIDYVMEIVPLLCISVIMDSLQGVLSGVARGCGWQHIGAYVNLGAFYLFGIPVALVLGFLLHKRGKGLWIGILGGATLQTLLLFIITSCINWQQQAKMAKERTLEGILQLENGLK